MQVSERCILGGAVAALVQALAVQAQRRLALLCSAGITAKCKPARGLMEIGFGNPAGARDLLGCGIAHQLFQVRKARGVLGDVVMVYPAFPEHDVQHAVKKQHVGARLQGQVQVGHFRRLGAAWVGHDDLELRVGSLGIFNAAK